MTPATQRFTCCRCGHEFRDAQRPSYSTEGKFMGYSWGHTECPKCGSIYMRKMEEQ